MLRARKDSLVKVNGHRIEIGGVESALLATKIVPDAIVVMTEIRNESQIDCGEPVDGLILDVDQHKELLTSLSLRLTTLASYMVPSVWIALKSVPQLPSGNANRLQLASLVQGMDNTIIDQ